MSGGVESWRGKEVSIIFDMQSTDWPIPGYPAFATIVEVDMPLILLAPIHGSTRRVWVNAKTIQQMRPQQE